MKGNSTWKREGKDGPVVLQNADSILFPESCGDRPALFLRQRNATVVVVHALLSVEVACV